MAYVLTVTADITSLPQKLAGHSILSAEDTPKTRHYALIAMRVTDCIRVSVFSLLKCPLRTKTPTVSKLTVLSVYNVPMDTICLLKVSANS